MCINKKNIFFGNLHFSKNETFFDNFALIYLFRLIHFASFLVELRSLN